MTKFTPLFLTFLILASLATLFPPFHWETGRPIPNGYNNAENLPNKYDFLFEDSTRTVKFNPNIDNEEDVEPVNLPFYRRLLVVELIAEYILAFFVSLIVYVLVRKIKPQTQRRT